MIEVVVSRLGMDPARQSYVVVLQEKDGTRLLPIWIGQAEARFDRRAHARREATSVR